MINRNYAPGDVIVRENTLGNSAYILEKGKVEVSKNIGRQRIVFTTLEPGSIFGEMSLIDNSPRSATVTAVEESTVTVVSKSNFQALLGKNGPLRSIFGVLAERLRETDKQVNPLRLTNLYFSLCSLIFHLTHYTSGGGDTLSADLPAVLDEVCTILAIDREQVERVVNRLAFTKLLRIEKEFKDGIERRKLVITDPGKFREWIEFLRVNSAAPGAAGISTITDNAGEAFDVLKVLRDNDAEYNPALGKTSVRYDNFVAEVDALLNLNREQTDKVIKPYLDAGLFKLTMDRENNTRRLVCTNPEKLDAELGKLENLKSYGKMAELLKAMAAN